MTTEELFDVIVIGAGVEGSATAYQLTKLAKEKRVALVEQFDAHHTRGSSHGGSRITRKAYPEEFYAAMMQEAYPLWEQLESESGRKIYIPTGVLHFGPSDSGVLTPVLETLSKQYVPHEVLKAEDANKRFNALNLPANYVCVLEEQAGTLRASVGVQILQELFVRNGGTLLEHHKVEQIQPGSPVRVITSKGVLNALQVVITAGPWSSKLVEPLGLKLPLKVVRIDVLYWEAGDDAVSHAFDESSTTLPAFGYYGHDRCDYFGHPAYEYPGLVKICLSSTGPTIDPDKRDLDPGFPSIPDVAAFIQNHFKGIELKPSIVERCLVTRTPDGHPFLGRHPSISNVVLGAGFSGHGFKLAPVFGKILAELALDRPSSYSLEPFKISRWSGLGITHDHDSAETNEKRK